MPTPAIAIPNSPADAPVANPAPTPYSPTPPPFTQGDWALVAATGLEALLLVCMMLPGDRIWGIPGFGFSLLAVAHIGLTFAALRSRAHLNSTTIPLLGATVICALLPSLTWNESLRFFSGLIAWATGTLTAFLMAGIPQRLAITWENMGAACVFSMRSLFAHTLRPLRAASQLGRPSVRTERAKAIALGLLLTAALLTLIVPMLTAADAMFARLAHHLALHVVHVSLPAITWRIVEVLAIWPFLFSILFARAHTIEAPPAKPGVPQRFRVTLPPLTAAMVLGAAIALYTVFLGVQGAYLFGGARVVGVAGGYAAYARSGFFQLTWVAALNVLVGLGALSPLRAQVRAGTSPAGSAPRPSTAGARVVRVLLLVLTAQSFALLASAIWRMSLYVGAYGLTLLRFFTYFAMAAIACTLAGIIAAAWRPHFSFFRFVLAVGLVLWCAFVGVNPEGRIAAYNLTHASSLANGLDVAYLRELSPSAERVVASAAGDHEALADVLCAYEYRRRVPWQMRALTVP